MTSIEKSDEKLMDVNLPTDFTAATADSNNYGLMRVSVQQVANLLFEANVLDYNDTDAVVLFCHKADSAMRTHQHGVLVHQLVLINGRHGNQSLLSATPVLMYTHKKAEGRTILEGHGADTFEMIGDLTYIIDRDGRIIDRDGSCAISWRM